jgi:peptide/nickel transport system substrate-binding protein
MKYRALAVLLGLAVILAACGGDQAEETTTSVGTTVTDGSSTSNTGGTTTAPPTTEGGTVRIGWGGAPSSLNPGLGELTEDYSIYEMVYNTPITLDLDGNYVGELATDWSVSADGLSWTMHLVPNATFHDGTPLTSEDVKFTLELYRDCADWCVYMSAYFDGDEVIEAPDPTTVTISKTAPTGSFEGRMVFMYILPRHIWEQVDPGTFDNTAMIGSGSFKLTEYRQGEYVRLAANEEYWGGSPHVDEVIFQTYENADARVQALINGDVDMITEFPATAIPTLEANENIAVATGEPLAPDLTDIIFNVTDPANCPAEDGICSGHPALRDVAVRQALAHAVDKQQLIDTLLLGLGTPGIAIVPTGLGIWFNDTIEDYTFDLTEANRILDEAGYLDTDGNGIRECPAGTDCGDRPELQFRLNYPDDSDTGPRLAQTLADWWGQVGVELEIQVLDPDTLTSVCCPSLDYDVIIWGWGSDPDPGFLLSALTCDEIPTGLSESGYCNPAYDALFAAQQIETDLETRVGMIQEMQQILWEDLPYIIPYCALTTEAYRTDRFVGWVDTATKLALEDPSSLNNIRPAG